MSTTSPAELSAAVIIDRIESGVFPREVLHTIAAGFLPLPQDDLIAVLAYLTASADESLAATARQSLADMPARIVLDFAANESARPDDLARLAAATDDPQLLEALIRNRAVSDDTVVQLARSADGALQEVVVINQARILRTPEILEALLANPRLTPDARRRALETREEFFEKQPVRPQVEPEVEVDEEEAVADLPLEPIADLLEKAQAEDASGQKPPQPEMNEADKRDPSKMSVFARVLNMTVAEKVQLAFKGGKSERMVLVRDRNKLVCGAVMRNPRMTDIEVESIASMRNVDEEVLRLIGMRREWMAKYNIVNILVRNPKAPVALVMPLINRLTLRDLKGLKDDKGVPEVVRALARKLYTQRSAKS